MAVKQIKIGASTFDLNAYDSDTVDGYHISVVSSVPSTKNNNTIYIVTG